MGRFKIYDPEKLVAISNDSGYAKCLLCETKLKFIMGNVKRHYEQMHSVYVNANASERKKSLKLKDDDKDFKINTSYKRVFNANKQHCKRRKKLDEKNTTETIIPALSTMNFINNMTADRIMTKQESIIETTKPEVINKVSLPLVFPNSKLKEEIESDLLKTKTTQHHHTHNSNQKKIKLNDESNDIKIPCFSYINSINISSFDSCHQVDFLKLVVETKSEMNIPLKNFQKGDTFEMALQNWKQIFQFDYSSERIGEHLDRMTKKLRQEITSMAANRIIYLKLDVANKNDSHIMLINIQFTIDFEIKVITLSAVDLQDHDLATNLKEEVLRTLERYQIGISRVHTTTKDNNKNIRDSVQYNTDETEICVIQEKNNNTNGLNYCEHLCEQFPGHAIHFVACDIIKQLNENISQSRDCVKSLRVQFSKLNIEQMLVIDNTFSWFSVYDMMKTLLNVRDIVENNSLQFIEVDWLFAAKFVESFRHIVDTASLLQSNKIFIMGDFYREWLLCEVELDELSTSNDLALYMVESLRKRKTDFFKNTSFLAGLYLDPRFCFMGSMYLSDIQKEIAIAQLLQIFIKLKEMQESKSNSSTFTSPNSVNIDSNDRYLKLEKNMADNRKPSMTTTSSNTKVSFNNADYEGLKESLQQLQFEERLPFNTNIMYYWKFSKYKNPLLSKIAEIALAAPATQATINRALDVLSITLMKNKLNDTTDIMENLIMLKLNQDLVKSISLEN